MTCTKGMIASIIRDKIAEFVGAEIGQVEFFNAEIKDGMKDESSWISIKYHGEELVIYLGFTEPDNPEWMAEHMASEDPKVIPLADDKLYKTDNWNGLCKTLDKHMQKFVGKTITAFLQKHNPKKGD